MIHRAPMTREEMKRAGFIESNELRRDAFWKGIKIIQSCETNTHVEGAERYIDTFKEVFENNYQSGVQYDVLLVALKEQKLKLKL
tara:strand:- start:219 stop:473 length:255 start_codon:yes stop_codon:yes gene_type:complete